jgi:hypothetical protein
MIKVPTAVKSHKLKRNESVLAIKKSNVHDAVIKNKKAGGKSHNRVKSRYNVSMKDRGNFMTPKRNQMSFNRKTLIGSAKREHTKSLLNSEKMA